MRIHHQFEVMYDVLYRFLYGFCGIDEIKVRLQVVICNWAKIVKISIDRIIKWHNNKFINGVEND